MIGMAPAEARPLKQRDFRRLAARIGSLGQRRVRQIGFGVHTDFGDLAELAIAFRLADALMADFDRFGWDRLDNPAESTW